jgi:glycosyltransferase involved in cell wall biosynthesis
MGNKIVIIPVYNRAGIIRQTIERIDESIGNQTDILIVDDGSEDETADLVKTSDHILLLSHEMSLGYGASIADGLRLSADLGYEYAVILDPATLAGEFVFSPILSSLAEGYDIVTASRMTLEDRGVANEDYSAMDTGSLVADTLNSITGYSFIDPFSPFKGFRLSIINQLCIEEYDEAAIIQIWIQSAHHGLRVKEIICTEINGGYIHEGEYLEHDVDHYLDFIESEKYLYPVGGEH